MALKIALAVLFVSLSFCATAQTVTDEPARKPPAKKVEPRKATPKKPAVPKKPAASKKPSAPAKSPAAPKPAIYDGKDPKAPILRDKDGNVIPTNPNAYDVSSAVGKK